MNIVAFCKEHLSMMGTQNGQSGILSAQDDERARGLEQALSFTGMVGDTVLVCAGVLEMWPGRYVAWAYVAPQAKRYWKSVHKAVKKFLVDLNARRVEMHVDCDFKAAHDWALRLGFKMECERMEKFLPDGRDAALYARVT
ncbi:MAG: hypothetical protein V4641_13085 [Pseudomonadota bacterium]